MICMIYMFVSFAADACYENWHVFFCFSLLFLRLLWYGQFKRLAEDES